MADRSATRRSLGISASVIAVVICGCSEAASTGSPSDVSAAATSIVTTVSGTTVASPTTVVPTTTSVVIVTVAGDVTRLLPGGDFSLNDGRTDYDISMARSPNVVDVDGAEVIGNAMEVGESVQVTGTVAGHTITAQTVIVPTRAPVTSTASSG